VLSIIEAAGWPIWTIILASVVSLAIIFERFYSLRQSLVAPAGLLEDVLNRSQAGDTRALYEQLVNGAPLARILAAGLKNQRASREVMKEAIEEAGRVVAHELERFLTTLGTIAAMAPLLGLLGTVVGMIATFQAITLFGTGDPKLMAGGISEALVTTMQGLVVAVPMLFLYTIVQTQSRRLIQVLEEQSAGFVARYQERLHASKAAA